jgi:hypothetical protein
MSSIGGIGIRMLLALFLMLTGCTAPPDALGCEGSSAEDCQAAFELAFERVRGRPPDTVAGAIVERVPCDQLSGSADSPLPVTTMCWLVKLDSAEGNRVEVPVIRQPGGRMTVPQHGRSE